MRETFYFLSVKEEKNRFVIIININKFKNMKKKKLNVNSLSLNKKTISNLNAGSINGGRKTKPNPSITICNSVNYCETALLCEETFQANCDDTAR